jgi:prepilin-type N-terminal cleavage/methylation domain-containing protein
MRINHRKKPQGFTLIEMVGVLAVIAILAAILVPKIFSAIEESRYNNAVASVNGVKAATMNYFAKNGSFVRDAGATKFDQRLIQSGDLERPFATRIGNGWECNAVAAESAGAVGIPFAKLDGTGSPASGTVVQCKIANVPVADAFELSVRLDGATMSATVADANTDGDNDPATDPTPGVGSDSLGRVVYAGPDANGLTDVFIYIAHK